MESSKTTSRREFFTSILGGLKDRVADNSMADSISATRKRIGFHPEFKGEYLWNHELQIWEQAWGIDELGMKLPSVHDASCVEVTTKAPPSIECFWNFLRGEWDFPIMGRDIFARMVMGKKLIYQYFRTTSDTIEARRLMKYVQRSFPQIPIAEFLSIGFVPSGDVYPDNIITLFVKKPPSIELQQIYGCSDDSINHRLKLYLGSKEVRLKLMHHHFAESDLPALPSLAKPQWVGRTYEQSNRVSHIQDVYFYASDAAVADYCYEFELKYPEELYGLNYDVHTFGVTFDADSMKPLKMKRYYMWWGY